MSQVASHGVRVEHNGVPPLASEFPALRRENIYVSSSGLLSRALLGVGILGIAGVIIGGLSVNAKHALAAYHVGAMSVLGASLAALFLCMFMQLVNTGWNATIRRQIENIASLVPAAAMMAIITIAIDVFKHGVLFTWMGSAFEGNYLLDHKSGYLNVGFFLLRALIYLLVWSFLAWRITFYSQMQDRTGDWNWTRKARKLSTWGIIIFAFTTAFAGFDWLKSLDFRFFSTMWGVYFFAGGLYACVATLILVLTYLRRAGKLEGLVTPEHFHDVGKLMLAFTVFWSYIAFSQYFLIWYSNIPEETSYFLHRTTGEWKPLFVFLCFGHFVAPFIVLVTRGVKRSTTLLTVVALWAIITHVADIFFVIRPMVYIGVGAPESKGVASLWVDAAGILGVLGLYGFLLARKVASGPLVPLQDPRYRESLTHKNYV
jgi:hypothetical protein